MPDLGRGLVWPKLTEPQDGPERDREPKDAREVGDECSRWAMLDAIEPASA